MKRLARPLAIAASVCGYAEIRAEETPLELGAEVISASALQRSAAEMTTAVETLEGDELLLRRTGTLGETLEHMQGLRNSSFGAGVGRPVIRGQAGARVRVLSDGVGVMDASNMSPDHAVNVESFLAERIEVLKGPATLLYGGGAIGGVVNVIDQRVPTAIPDKGYEGAFEYQANTVANRGSGVLGITAGKDNWAVRIEGVKRQDQEYEIPGSPSHEDSSYSDTHTYSIGVSYIGSRGYLGVAYSQQQNQYGLLGHEHGDCHQEGVRDWYCGEEEDHDDHDEHEDHDEDEEDHDHEHAGTPYIDMEQKRWDVRGELSDPLPGFESARFRLAYTDYEHQEIEGSEVSTRFDNDAYEGRLELTHAPILGWRGVIGGQIQRRDFESSGEESNAPRTLTHTNALFWLGEYEVGDWRYELGWRKEWQDIDARGESDTTDHGTSFSAGLVWNFLPEHALSLSFSRSQRLPTPEELYSDGPHAASSTVELGNQDLNRETSHNIDIGLRKLSGDTTYSLNLYRNTVSDYIYAADTGRDIGNYREIEYRQEDAILTGIEAELRQQLTPDTAVTFFGDKMRGKLRDGGGDLPRIPAARLGATLDHRLSAGLTSQLEFYRVWHQHDVAEYETTTPGRNMLSAGLTYQGFLPRSDYTLYLKGDNLLDVKWRNHTSFIKDRVLMPGRNLTLGLRLDF